MYNTLFYTGEPCCSIAALEGMKERTVVINSFSKSYAMTGWRIGYAAGPAGIPSSSTSRRWAKTSRSSRLSSGCFSAAAAAYCPGALAQALKFSWHFTLRCACAAGRTGTAGAVLRGGEALGNLYLKLLVWLLMPKALISGNA